MPPSPFWGWVEGGGLGCERARQSSPVEDVAENAASGGRSVEASCMQLSPTSTSPRFLNKPYHQVIAADLDGDGDLDLVSANRPNDRVVWYENLLVDTEETTEETTPAPLVVATPSPDLTASENPTPAPSPAERSITPTPPPAFPIDGETREIVKYLW